MSKTKINDPGAHHAGSGALIRRFLPYLAKYKMTLFLDLFCAALTTLCDIVLPKIMSTITNAAMGVGITLTAQIVLRLKREFPGLELFLILPCRDQARGWSPEEILQYEAVQRRADRVVYIEENYTEGCMHQRNRAMVDSSHYCIYYKTQSTGGTAYTVDYAAKKGLELLPVGITRPHQSLQEKWQDW